VNLKQNYQKTTTYLRNAKWVKTLGKIGYFTLNAFPAVPFYVLIKQYTKPKEKRIPWKVNAGYFGLGAFITKTIIFVSLGLSISFLIDKCSSEDEILKENTLKKTITLEDTLKNIKTKGL